MIENNEIYIVSEFMDNGTLSTYLDNEVLLVKAKKKTKYKDWPIRLQILQDIAMGMTCLHDFDPPILHRGT